MLILVRGHPIHVRILCFMPRLDNLRIVIIEGSKLAMGRLIHLVVDSTIALGGGNRLRLMIARLLKLLFQLRCHILVLIQIVNAVVIRADSTLLN